MKITPIDIRQAAFPTRFRGYDPAAVRVSLDQIADALEAWVKENSDLHAKIQEQDRIIMELKQAEITLTTTLVTAQKAMEEMKASARKEVELMIRQAELRSEEITQAATRQANQIQGEIVALLKQRGLFIERIRAMMQSFEKVLQWETEKTSGGTRSGGTESGGTGER